MKDDKVKCDKYEAFFVFQNEEAFYNHLKECPDCQKEHEKQMKISSLVKEVAPVYLKKQEQNKKLTAIKKLACCFVLFVGITASYTGYNMYNDFVSQDYWTEDTYVGAMGLPVDEYGFLEL